MIIMCFEDVILLPNPLYGNTVNNSVVLNLKRSKTGALYSHRKDSGRRQYVYEFDLSFSKATELRDFYEANKHDDIRWIFEGTTYFGIFIDRPHQITYGVRSSVTMKMETRD
jgi:hypothetical protein